jgi:hypothetical protein
MDLEAMVAAKDFAVDARIFWEELGLPVTGQQMQNSVAAFENNFRKHMTEVGIPDYRGMEYSIFRRQQVQDELVILTLDCHFPDGRHSKWICQCSERPLAGNRCA